MIVIDNCILSSLAKISRLDLLAHLAHPVTSPGVIEEIFRSEIEALIDPIPIILDVSLRIQPVKHLRKISVLRDDHPALSFVDCELIVLCLETSSSLLSDDSKLLGIAEESFDIPSYDLCDLLLAMKDRRTMERNELLVLIRALEKEDHYRFSAKNLRLLEEENPD